MTRTVLAVLAAALITTAGALAAVGDPGTTSDPAALTAPAPPDYQGLRLDREWTATDTPKTFGAPTAWSNRTLADDQPLDTTGTINGVPVNPAAATEIQRQATAYGTYLNRKNFAYPITFVAANQALTPVDCSNSDGSKCYSGTYQMMAGMSTDGVTYIGGGLPIPPGWDEANPEDTDGSAVLYQPDYVSPCSSADRGRIYEAWKLRRNANYNPALPLAHGNMPYNARWGGRAVATERWTGAYTQWVASGCQYKTPGAPNSTYRINSFGVEASGLSLATTQISREDCARGRIDHVIGLMLHDVKKGAFRAPAQRTDGRTTTPNVEYGMILRLPAGLEPPAGLSRIGRMIFDTAQDHGLILDDLTGSSVGVRVEPTAAHGYAAECTALLDGQAGYDVLKRFPFSQLQVLAP